MTRNQIAYWEHVETQRANKARETETHRANVAHETETRRHNLIDESIRFGTLNESQRHNRAYEQELNRHNLAQEDLGYKSLSETTRHNVSMEEVSRSQLAETSRHNLSMEDINRSQLAETTRHNLASENLGYYSANLSAQTTMQRTMMEIAQSKYNAELSAATARYGSDNAARASMYGADFGYKAAELTNRTRIIELNDRRLHDIVTREETMRHNKAQEQQRNREITYNTKLKAADVLIDLQNANTRTYDAYSRSLNNMLGNIIHGYSASQPR